jgi:endonuclease YncB( thermonuclease family)
MRSLLYHYSVQVERVIDGDTLFCVVDLGFDIKMRSYVRLFGVDTPEIFGRDAGPEGYEAKQFVLDWLASRPKLTLHSRRYNEREKYGRILGEIYSDEEVESLNEALVSNGHARGV